MTPENWSLTAMGGYHLLKLKRSSRYHQILLKVVKCSRFHPGQQWREAAIVSFKGWQRKPETLSMLAV